LINRPERGAVSVHSIAVNYIKLDTKTRDAYKLASSDLLASLIAFAQKSATML
jgi:hypothetical protein